MNFGSLHLNTSQYSAKKTSKLHITWIPPPYPFYKLNTDGSVGPNTEITVILEGLKLASQHGFTPLIIESDSIAAITLLQKNSNDRLLCLIDDYRLLMSKLGQVELQYSYREGNRVADLLAAQGRTSESTTLNILEEPSETLKKFVAEDQGPVTLLRSTRLGLG